MVGSESPLVTFVVMSFNAENFIEQALMGALAQDYDNLEIIVSDDCSSDGTVSRIEKVVSSYQGPHKVVVNKNPNNLGTLAHFFKVVDLASGRLIVFSAADDVSKPERTSETVRCWSETGFQAFFSDYDVINDRGVVIKSGYSPGSHSAMLANVFGNHGSLEIHGASSAYDVDFLNKVPRPEARFIFEDAFMTFMLNLYEMPYVKISRALVYYREHSGSVSNSLNGWVGFKEEREKQVRLLGVYENRYELSAYLYDYACSGVFPGFSSEAYKREMKKFKIKSCWAKSSYTYRLRLLLDRELDLQVRKWILPRVFGLNFFVFIKVFYRMANNIFRSRV